MISTFSFNDFLLVLFGLTTGLVVMFWVSGWVRRVDLIYYGCYAEGHPKILFFQRAKDRGYPVYLLPCFSAGRTELYISGNQYRKVVDLEKIELGSKFNKILDRIPPTIEELPNHIESMVRDLRGCQVDEIYIRAAIAFEYRCTGRICDNLATEAEHTQERYTHEKAERYRQYAEKIISPETPLEPLKE